jgi:hypothetical protein
MPETARCAGPPVLFNMWQTAVPPDRALELTRLSACLLCMTTFGQHRTMQRPCNSPGGPLKRGVSQRPETDW